MHDRISGYNMTARTDQEKPSMQGNLRIRTAKNDDLNTITALYNLMFDRIRDTSVETAIFERCIDSGMTQIVFIDDTPIGYCAASTDPIDTQQEWNDAFSAKDSIYLHFLGVLPSSRKRGIGNELLKKCIEETGQNGRKYITGDFTNGTALNLAKKVMDVLYEERVTASTTFVVGKLRI